MIFLKEFKKQTYDSDDVAKYYHFLKEKFANQVYGRIRSNPISIVYHDKKLKLKQTELSDVLSNVAKLKKYYVTENERILTQYSTIKNNLNDAKLDNHRLSELLKQSDESNKKMKNKIETIETKSFWQKLKNLFN